MPDAPSPSVVEVDLMLRRGQEARASDSSSIDNVVVGDLATLSTDAHWRALFDHAIAVGSYRSVFEIDGALSSATGGIGATGIAGIVIPNDH